MRIEPRLGLYCVASRDIAASDARGGENSPAGMPGEGIARDGVVARRSTGERNAVMLPKVRATVVPVCKRVARDGVTPPIVDSDAGAFR